MGLVTLPSPGRRRRFSSNLLAVAELLKVGEQAPEFDLEATPEGRLSTNDLRGSAYVLFFFPKAGTPG